MKTIIKVLFFLPLFFSARLTESATLYFYLDSEQSPQGLQDIQTKTYSQILLPLATHFDGTVIIYLNGSLQIFKARTLISHTSEMISSEEQFLRYLNLETKSPPYYLFVSAHGAGWVSPIGEIPAHSLLAALNRSAQHWEALVFDVCQLGSYEIARLLPEKASYFMAPEKRISIEGLHYKTLLGEDFSDTEKFLIKFFDKSIERLRKLDVPSGELFVMDLKKFRNFSLQWHSWSTILAQYKENKTLDSYWFFSWYKELENGNLNMDLGSWLRDVAVDIYLPKNLRMKAQKLHQLYQGIFIKRNQGAGISIFYPSPSLIRATETIRRDISTRYNQILGKKPSSWNQFSLSLLEGKSQ